jgi:hypothetical protein
MGQDNSPGAGAVSDQGWFGGGSHEVERGFNWLPREGRNLTDPPKEEEEQEVPKKIKVRSHTRSRKGGAPKHLLHP